MDPTFHNTTNDSISELISSYSFVFTAEVVNRSVLSIYMIFGLIGNIFNIFLFTSPVLSRTSSSFYLLSTSIANLFVTLLAIPFRLFADGFYLDPTEHSLLACRVISYIYYVCLALPPCFTVLGCADRWAASSIQVNRRRLASMHIAKRLVLLVIVLCCLLYSYILFTFSVSPDPPPPYCSIDDTYAVFGLTYQLIIYSLIPPFLMTIFSISIIINVRRKRTQVIPVMLMGNTSVNGGMIRRDRRQLSQMQVMLVCQSIIECLFTLPFAVINFVSILVENDEYFLGIYSYVRLLIFFNYISSFYIYTLSSKLYRDEFKKLAKKVFHHH